MGTQPNLSAPTGPPALLSDDLAAALAQGRVYFGPRHRASQGTPTRLHYMLATVRLLALRRCGRPLRILEIGSWAGGSALTWAEGIARYNAGKGSVLCIDA